MQQSLHFLGAGRRKEEHENSVHRARDDLSFSPVPAGGPSLLQISVFWRRYCKGRSTGCSDHALGAPARLMAAQGLHFEPQLGLNPCQVVTIILQIHGVKQMEANVVLDHPVEAK